MTEFFSSVRGALSVYCSSDDGQLTDARFVLARFGEDQDKVVAAFFHEHSDARFSIVPLFAYGSPPRKELCTKQSLTAALKSAKIEPNGTVTSLERSLLTAQSAPECLSSRTRMESTGNRYLRPS